MPVRPLLEIRTDLIDTLVSYGIAHHDASRVADSVVSLSGQLQDSNLTYAGVLDTNSAMSLLSLSLQAVDSAGVTPILPGVDFAGLATQVNLLNSRHPASLLATTATKKVSSGPPMWKDGPPQPGWLVPKLILAKRTTDQLFFVSATTHRVYLQRMPGPIPEEIITDYQNLHRGWRSVDYLLCDDCRCNDLAETICEDCARRRLRRTGDLRWELPKFCKESLDDLTQPPTRFERDPVI
jgi:hypothetical protein